MSNFYHTQKMMRQMREAALQRGSIAVLDIGSSKISCLIVRFDDPDGSNNDDALKPITGQTGFRVLGAATTKSRGVHFGEVEAMRDTETAIRTTVQAAQKMAGLRVDHAVACFAGARPKSYGLNGEVALTDKTVTQSDISAVLSACDIPDIGENRHILHAHPVNFILDNQSGLLDPRDQRGNTLGVDMHIITARGNAIANLVHCIKRCDLDVAGLASSAYVSGLSSLIEDEQKLGAACIDMGGECTTLSIFLQNHMIYSHTVRMGGQHVTNDISMGLSIPVPAAERIKTFHGGLVATGMDDRDIIELTSQTGDWEHDRRKISRTELIGIIEPRVSEILEAVQMQLEIAGFYNLSSHQIVLTGGASQIPGLDRLAANVFGQKIRLGRPLRIRGLPQATSGPAFASAVGLGLFAAKPQDEWWDFDLPADSFAHQPLKRAVQWFKNNW